MSRFTENVKSFGRRIECWMDRHPRTGWYVAGMSTLNVILNLVAIFGH